jgi:hypothetical protein
MERLASMDSTGLDQAEVGNLDNANASICKW